MAKQLTADDAKQSLTAHVETKGVEIYLKYGPQFGWTELQRLLADRAHVRYPCDIEFNEAALLPGEFAHPAQKGERPEDGFIMSVHPHFASQLDRAAALVLYQLVAVNYGEFASSDEAETFGAACLGLTRDEYYNLICEAADEIGPIPQADAAESPPHSGCSGGGCSCGG